MTDKMGLHDMM